MAQPRPTHDPTIYPTDDGMGENTFETCVRELLRPLLARFLAARGTPMFVGGNQFIYWEQHNPTASVAPDVYVVPGLAPDREPASIKTFELGPSSVPSFALEIVSSDLEKDYLLAPRRYDALGVRELLIYDHGAHGQSNRAKFLLHRRRRGRGLELAVVTDEDRIESRVLGCYLREVVHGESTRLRLGVGPGGDELFPTEAEEREAEGLRAGLLLGKAEGLLAGKAEGLLAGKAEGLRQAVGVACELLSIELTPARRARLASLDAEGLEALLAALRARRRWPR
jgi:hypothetical protein